MEKIEKVFFENREKKPMNTTVLIQRHGSTLYLERMKPDFKNNFDYHPRELNEGGLDLTEKGIEDIKQSVQEILDKGIINKEKDLVVIVASPQLRTISTALIDLMVLENNGVDVFFPREDYVIAHGLRQRGATNEGNMPKIIKDYSEHRKTDKTTPRFKNPQETHRQMARILNIQESDIFSEKFENIGSRFENFLRHAFDLHKLIDIKDEKIKKQLQDGSKRLVLLCVTHTEVPSRFMDKYFPGYDCGLENSQFMEINTDANSQNKYKAVLYPKGSSKDKSISK